MNGLLLQRRVCRSSQNDRVRRSSQSEGGRRKRCHHVLDDHDGFRESSTHLAICCLTGSLICLTGKSVDLVGDWPVQPPLQKDFCFSEMQIILYDLPSRPTEGRFAIVTDAGRDAVDADAPITNGAEADGKVVWS